MENKICYNCFSTISGDAGACPNCGYDPAADAGKYPLALPHGSILNGRYVLGRALGQGGFGITYIAQDVQTGERIAIKEYFPQELATRTGSHSVTAFSGQRQQDYEYGMTCFLSEAQTLAQFIGAENIVRVHSYFEENGTAYFAMDYVEGTSFQAYLKQRGGKISWEEAKRVLFPVMDALSLVHSKGIIHRDIAPDNIYITKDDTVKLLDFGAARYSLGDRSQSLDVLLKRGYAPMEQYVRRGKQGAFTDVYAMAATFYYALTGALPPESVERIEEDHLTLPSRCGAVLPGQAEKALEKGLALLAADRYQTMAEFRQALDADVPAHDPKPRLPMKAILCGAAAVLAMAFLWGGKSVESIPEPPVDTVSAHTEQPEIRITQPSEKITQTKPAQPPQTLPEIKPTQPPETIPETTEDRAAVQRRLYQEAVNAYENGRYSEAKGLFQEVEPYADSSKYLRLIRIRNAGGNIGVGSAVYVKERGLRESEKRDIMDAANDFYFADTAQVLLCNSDVACYYLVGDWDGGSKCYIHFKMNNYGGTYNIGSKLSTNYQSTFSINDGELRVDVNNTNALTMQLTLSGPNTMEVLTYEKGGQSYTLTRK